jgi:choline-sulfatase
MLYNVDMDPHLQQDLAAQFPEVCLEAKAHLADWQDEMLGSMPAGYTMDPMRTVLAEGGPFHVRGCLRSYLQRLRDTSRSALAERLGQLHPGEL